jgi:hypothetical protein
VAAPRTARQADALLNRVAAEVGVAPTTDPMGSSDPTFVQLQYLLNTAGEELALLSPWEAITREHAIATQSTDSGDYPLPDDFNYMIDQTGWERAENVPLMGPLSPQDWQYLLGRDLVTTTIYASFRLEQSLFRIFPRPPPDGLDIHFEYVSQNWVQDADNPQTLKPLVEKNGDLPLYNGTLIARYVKLKYYQSKGLPTQLAQDDFNTIFAQTSGQDKGAPILSAGRWNGGVPYLNSWVNVPFTGYGI